MKIRVGLVSIKLIKKRFFIPIGLMAGGLIVFFLLVGRSRLADTKQNIKESVDATEKKTELHSIKLGQNAASVAPPDTHRSLVLSPNSEMPSLNADEKEVFFKEIAHIFGTLGVATIDPAVMEPHLSRLNGRGAAGLVALVGALARPALSDPAVQQRIHLIDYLNYRIKWDPMAKSMARALILAPIPKDSELRYQATSMIEKSEILAGLVAVDWDEAVATLRALDNDRIKRIALKSAFEVLINQGHGKEDALAKVKIIDPLFRY